MEETEMPAQSFAEIEPVDLEAIWRGFMYAGTVTILAGPGGGGKTFVADDIGARVSRGDMMPDGSAGSEPGAVIIAGLEDSPEASTIHRLTAAKADLSMIYDASVSPSGAPFDITTDLPWLREVNDQVGGARLVIIDTLSAASPVSLTGVAGVRRIMRGVLAFTGDTGAACLILHHVTKAGDVAGSRAVVDSVRQVLTISRSDTDPRIRALHVHKSNVAGDLVPDVRFMLTGAGQGMAVEWLADIGQQRGRGPAGTGQARILLLLRNTSYPLTAQEIASKTGISYATVRVQLHRLVRAGEVNATARNSFVAAAA
jgi:AAA domain/HTH domain